MILLREEQFILKIKVLLFVSISLGFMLFYIVNSPYRLERVKKFLEFQLSLNSEKPHFKSKIITDEKTLAYSEKVYHLSLASDGFTKEQLTQLLNEIDKVFPLNKKRVVAQYIKKKYNKREFIVLIYGLNTKNVSKMRTILEEFLKDSSFKSKKQYFSFKLSGERRVYPYDEFLTPVIGYTHKYVNKNDLTYVKGVEGLEAFYNDARSDVGLNIDFNLQSMQENEVDRMKKNLSVYEVISITIDPITFKVKAFASSNRYNPKNIKREDYQNLNIKAIRYLFEIGKLIEPIDLVIKMQNLKDGYKKFGFYEKSGIDLKYEQTFDNKKLDQNTTQYKINFIQLVKMYAVLYGNGKIASPQIAKQNKELQRISVMSEENAKQLKDKLAGFFPQMKDYKLILDFRDYKRFASIYMKETIFKKQKLLQAYFIIDKVKLSKEEKQSEAAVKK